MRWKGHVKGKWVATEQNLHPQSPSHSHSADTIHGSSANTLNGHEIWKALQAPNSPTECNRNDLAALTDWSTVDQVQTALTGHKTRSRKMQKHVVCEIWSIFLKSWELYYPTCHFFGQLVLRKKKVCKWTSEDEKSHIFPLRNFCLVLSVWEMEDTSHWIEKYYCCGM